MRKVGTVSVLLAVVLLAGMALAQTSTRPPTNLKKVGDHWTPWDPPAAGSEDYIIERGDTLWDLSKQWFGDPFLWPQIWDENRYILDSHWIYPGDPLVVPGRPTVVPDAGAGLPPVADRGRKEPPKPDLNRTPQPPPLVPAAFESDLYCSGYIEHMNEAPRLWVAGRELEKRAVAEGDVIFLSAGRDQGLRAGDEFAVIRRTDSVRHPSSRLDLGTYVRRLGKVRVLIAHEQRSTAVITRSCEDILDDDELVPWSDIPVPMLASDETFDRLDPSSSGGPTGTIVSVRDHLSAFAAGHVIYTDLGRVSGVQPGDKILLYRERDRGNPRMILGQGVILTVETQTSTAKIMVSARESMIGDMVELLR